MDQVADLVRVFPWYYFDGGDPLTNGVVGSHLAVQGFATVVLAVLAVVGVRRRDLVRGDTTGGTLLEKVRSNPMAARALERLGGGAAVSSIRRAFSQQGILFILAS